MAFRYSSQRAASSAAAAGRGLVRGAGVGRRCRAAESSDSTTSLARPFVRRGFHNFRSAAVRAGGRRGCIIVRSRGSRSPQQQQTSGQQVQPLQQQQPLALRSSSVGGLGSWRHFGTFKINLKEIGRGWEESPGYWIRAGGDDGLDGDPGTPPPIDKSVVTSPTQKVLDVMDALDDLDFVETSMLIELMKDKMGLDEVPTLNLPGQGGGGGDGDGGDASAAPAEEKTVFSVNVTGFGEKAKIKVIKEVRGITGLGLREAKELVESLPKVVKADVKKEEGEKLMEILIKAGATVELI